MSHVAEVEPPAAQPRQGASKTVLFGGVRFELMADFADVGLHEEHQRFAVSSASASGRVLADVTVALQGMARPRAMLAPTITRAWVGDRASISLGDVHAELVELAPRRYAARASVGPDSLGVCMFLSAATSTIVERLGGVIVHASGIALGERGVLFVGPSGAGKTTAAHHCDGAAWFAKDRAAIVPFEGGYVTFGMPGGDEIHLPQTANVVRRLAGVARIRRDRPEITLERLDTLDALAVLRENTFAGGDASVEEQRLDTLLAVAASVPVASLHTRLGSSLTTLIEGSFA